MGIEIDLDRSYAKFADPGLGDFGFNLQKVFRLQMHAWEIQFGVKFNPDPARGLGAAPPAPQAWRLGIVQNVLFERLLLVFEDQSGARPPQRLAREQPMPAIDMITGSTETPYYNSAKAGGNALSTRPVEHIVYSGKGYREAADRSPGFSNAPATFNLWDQPETNIPFRKDGTFRLRRIEKVLIFQAWLVAESPAGYASDNPLLVRVRHDFVPAILRGYDNYRVLGHVPPFSTTFWAEIDLAGFRPRSSIDDPAFTWGLYGGEGFFPKQPIDRRVRQLGAAPLVKPAAGDGGRQPVLSGPPSIKASDEWFSKNGLHL